MSIWLILVLLTLWPCIGALNVSLTFSPASVDGLLVGSSIDVLGNASVQSDDEDAHFRLSATVRDPRVALLLHFNATTVSEEPSVFSLRLDGQRLGQTQVQFELRDENNASRKLTAPQVIDVIVLRPSSVHDKIFQVISTILIVIVIFLMGCDLEPGVIFAYLRRPLAPGIGFASQFLVMPLLAFGLGFAIPINKAFGFGLLTVGCSPGGGASNVFTILLNGDLNLSMTMTFLSSIFAIGMMPLWLLLLGRFLISGQAVIPYSSIVLNLLQVILPCLFGIVVRWRFLQIALRLRAALKWVSTVYVLFLLIYGTYVNAYMYELMYDYPIVIPASTALPWLGFLFGSGLATIARQGKARAITIGLETGCQNTGIAILILLYSIPRPLGQMAAVVPVLITCVTPLPPIALILLRAVRGWWKRRQERLKSNEKVPLVTSKASRSDGEPWQEGGRAKETVVTD